MDTGRRRYAVYAIVYLAPYLRFDCLIFSFLLVACVLVLSLRVLVKFYVGYCENENVN